MRAGAVYVGRPSRWGNPFRVGARYVDGRPPTPAPWPYLGVQADGVHQWRGPGGSVVQYEIGEVRDAEHAVDLFRRHIAWENADCWSPEHLQAELGCRDLACWCPLDQPCHADVLLEIANRPAVAGG